jgi:rubrerythrin
MHMPTFGSPFSGLAKDKKISNEELIRAIRFTIAAEYEATQQYMQLAELIDHTFAIKVLTEIANEERVHAGELLRLLHELSPDEAKFYAKGAKEVGGENRKMNWRIFAIPSGEVDSTSWFTSLSCACRQ